MRRISAAVTVFVWSVALCAPAAGARPFTTRTCGDAWTVVPEPAPPAGASELVGVATSSATEAWAVGYEYDPVATMTHATIRRWDGTSWTVATPAVLASGTSHSGLAGLTALAPDDAWAVGAVVQGGRGKTLVEHWDGTSWTRTPSANAGHPAEGGLSGVAALAADDVWAVGSYGEGGGPGRTLVEHWDGTSWSVVASPNKGPWPNTLSAVAAVASNDVWAVGTWFTKAFVDRTLVLHWDGTRWRRVPSPSLGNGENRLVSVAAVAADDVWAVGSRGLHTLAEHWDGASWTVVRSPTPGGNADLAGVAAVATDEVWAVGGRVDRQANAIRTLVERWDGTGWSVVDSANKGTSDNHLWGVAAMPGRAFAVGSRFPNDGTGELIPLVLERCGT